MNTRWVILLGIVALAFGLLGYRAERESSHGSDSVKMYRNTDMGIEFQYPPGYYVTTRGSTINVTDQSDNLIIQIDHYEKSFDVSSLCRDLVKTPATINAIPGFRISCSAPGVGMDGMLPLFLFDHHNFVFVIYPGEDFSGAKDLVISSLKIF